MTKQVKYKDTGLEWCPQIPEHWELKKLKYVALVQPSNVDKKTEKDEIPVLLCNYVDVYKNDYIVNSLPFMEATAKNNEIEKYQLVIGDVIITKDSETAQDIAIPAYVKETAPNLLCGYHLAQIRSNQVDIIGEYLFRLFQSKMFNSNFEIGANGVTRYGLGVEVTQSTFVLLPPLSEQQKIADYLDQKTTLIDSIIAKKEKQIELYKEERTAVINHAVTKGLNPDVKMKDSGIEWLGEIPKHWEVKKLKYVVTINDEVLSDKTEEDYELLYVEIGDVSHTTGISQRTQYKFSDAPSRARRIVKNGDIIVSTVRTYLKAITSIIEPEDNLIVSTGFAVLRPISVNSSFLGYYSLSTVFIDKVISESKGVGYPAINALEIGNIHTTLPSELEQQQIVSFLDQETQRIDTLIEKTTKEIDLLKEYKEALINEVVTGQKIIE